MTAAGTDTTAMTAVERAAVERYEAAVAVAPCPEVEDSPLRELAVAPRFLASWWVLIDELDAVVHAPDRAPTPPAVEYVDLVVGSWFSARQQWLSLAAEGLLALAAPPGQRRTGVPRPDIDGAVSTSTRPDAGALAYVPPPS